MKIMHSNALKSDESVGSNASSNFSVFKAEWSGESFGNKALARCWLSINTSIIPGTPGIKQVIVLPDPAIEWMAIQVKDTTRCDGIYSGSDCVALHFWLPQTLDLDRELVGQSTGFGRSFGITNGSSQQGDNGDFNIFFQENVNLEADYFFCIKAGRDRLRLSSLVRLQ